jgi:serine/threonine protein kinase
LKGFDWDSVFKKKKWKNVSVEARDFIQLMLLYDPSSRPTAKQAISHKWFKHTVFTEIEKGDPRLALIPRTEIALDWREEN